MLNKILFSISQFMLKLIHKHVKNSFYVIHGGDTMSLTIEENGVDPVPYRLANRKSEIFKDIIRMINSWGSKRYIVSTYNSYEWINTESVFSLRVLMYDIENFRCISKECYDIEEYDPNKDQITYHTPYNNY